ncbi:hypothetical protein GCM10011360_05950 [Primorskyibacter flagellatus]|uniref:DUF883 domain-containing protein n=1 Tax=Primorskyibacter flagellatus TaxID=1387277 RepID=A0A917EBF6_9RHOB|nr:DUF883 family protein [Primorskyibacter flagellatus]GGE20037.1 hypothetical protein GCM10011360_05950 [Primorskyibacter flagellatus]
MARTETANGSTAATKPTSDDLREQIAVLQADVAKLTRTMGDFGRAQGEQAKAAATRTAEDLRLRADHLRQDAEAQLRTGYAQAETAVRDNPAAAVGLAAGIGFVLGLLSSRR